MFLLESRSLHKYLLNIAWFWIVYSNLSFSDILSFLAFPQIITIFLFISKAVRILLSVHGQTSLGLRSFKGLTCGLLLIVPFVCLFLCLILTIWLVWSRSRQFQNIFMKLYFLSSYYIFGVSFCNIFYSQGRSARDTGKCFLNGIELHYSVKKYH